MTHRSISLLIGVIVGACGLAMVQGVAHADCVQWGRTLNGDRVCIVNDAVNRNPVFPEVLPLTGGTLTGGSTFATQKPPPECDDGWTLVADLTMQPMCARELRKPR